MHSSHWTSGWLCFFFFLIWVVRWGVVALIRGNATRIILKLLDNFQRIESPDDIISEQVVYKGVFGSFIMEGFNIDFMMNFRFLFRCVFLIFRCVFPSDKFLWISSMNQDEQTYQTHLSHRLMSLLPLPMRKGQRHPEAEDS